MIDDKIYLETMIELDGPIGGNNLNTEEDVTPCQRDFHEDEWSKNEPVGMLSKANDEGGPWVTPSALKQGHPSRDVFQNDTDEDYKSENEAERDTKEGRKDNITSTVCCQSKMLFVELMRRP